MKHLSTVQRTIYATKLFLKFFLLVCLWAMAKPKRTVTDGLDVTATAELLDEFCKRKGMKKVELVGRIVRWFSLQPQVVQSVVAGIVDEGAEEAYAAALERIAKQLRERDPLEGLEVETKKRGRL